LYLIQSQYELEILSISAVYLYIFAEMKIQNGGNVRKILIYLKDYKKESILAPLFKMLEAAFELLVPLVMAAVIDVGIKDQNEGYIIKMLIWMILLGVIGLVCSITAQYFSAKAAVGFATKLKSALFAHIQNLSFAEIDQLGTPTLITRLTSDVNQVQSGVNMVLRLFLRSPFIVFGAMVMAFTIDVKGAFVFCVAIPLLAIVVFGIMLKSIPLYRKVQEAVDGILGIARENLTGVRVIRAFHKEHEEKENFEKKNLDLTTIQIYAGRISSFMNPVTYIIINVALAVLLYIGAIRVDTGIITQGQVIALVNYMSQILVELIKLANLIITITKAVACGNRIQKVFEEKNSLDLINETKEKADFACGEDEIVTFSDVSYCYKGAGGESLTDINFSIKKGETVGIIGGTGSGKTTLVHLIPRFYDCSKGNVYIHGKNVKDYSVADLRNRVGIVMQKAVLFQGTIRENLLWGNTKATEHELNQALITAQAQDVIKNKEDGLESRVERGGRNFSGGQRQRLTIARALVKKPEILILDDSASALDFATDAKLRKALKEIDYAPAVFIVSQRTSSIQHADKILVLDNGEISGIGTHDTLLESCEIYKEIYQSQYKINAG